MALPGVAPKNPYPFQALKGPELGQKLYAKVEEYRKASTISTLHGRLANAYQYYFGLDPSGIHATSQVLRAGDEGELAEIRVNHSRSLVNTLLNLIIGPKVVWAAKATNRDYDSLRETALANAILEYYWGDRKVSKYAIRALEEAIVFTEGFVFVEWDPEAGEEVGSEPDTQDAETGEQIPGRTTREGDIRFTNVSSWDVIRDPNKPTWEDLDWVIVRLRRNKFDLGARYPASSDKVLHTPDDRKTDLSRSGGSSTVDTDDVDVFVFLHRPSPALPDGRVTTFIAGGEVLADVPMDETSLLRVSPADLTGTPFGYSPYLEILGIQELMDSLESSIASNQSTFATQNIAMPMGTDIDDVAGGMRAFYTGPDGQKPEALQLCRTPPEVFQHLEAKKRDQELLMGLNSVVRGTVPGGPKEMSGAALALLQSQALQQSSVLQADYMRLIECLGDAVIRNLRKNASEPRKVDLVGKANRYLVAEQSFVGKNDLGRVKRVTVEIGNPLSQTAAGRAEIADKLIAMKIVRTPEQYEQVLMTGRLDPLTHSTEDELMLVLSENEDISNGITPPVMIHDDAALHCREHRSTVASPNARKNPAVLRAAMDHIHAHYAAYFGIPVPPGMPPDQQYAAVMADPLYRERMLFLMGLPPTPPPLMGIPPAPPPGMTPNGGTPPAPPGLPGRPPGPPAPEGPPQLGNGDKLPGLPKPPTNPATGQKWDPQTGGGVVPPRAGGA